MEYKKNYKVSKGFTLVELLIGVTIMGILVAAATPSFRETVIKNKTSGITSDFKMALYIAQNEAIKRGINVTVRANSQSSRVWQGGWKIFVDNDTDGVLDSGEEIIQDYTIENPEYPLKAGLAAFQNYVSFTAAGTPRGSSGDTNGDFTVCRPDGNGSLSKTITISFAGNITVTDGVTGCSS